MAFEQERALLAEANSRFLTYSDTEAQFDREIVRYWPKEINNPELLELALTFLNTFGSVWGYSEDPTNGRPYITDPSVGGVTFSGNYRIVETRKASTDNDFVDGDRNTPGIVQVLRRGFHQSEDWGTPEDGVCDGHVFTDSRVLQRSGSRTTPEGEDASEIAGVTGDSPNDLLVIEMRNIEPASVQHILHSDPGGLFHKAIHKFKDPVVRKRDGANVELTGTYVLIAAAAVPAERGDPSASIRLTLAQDKFVLKEAYRSYVRLWSEVTRTEFVHYLWRVPKTEAQGILNDWKTVSGRSGSVEYSPESDFVNIVLRDLEYSGPMELVGEDIKTSFSSCSRISSQALYWGVYDPTGYNIDTARISAGSGWTYDRDIRLLRDEGRFDIIINAHQTIATGDTGYRRTVESTQGVTYEYVQRGIPPGQAQSIAGDSRQGVAYAQRVTVNPDCTRDVISSADVSRDYAVTFGSSRTAFVVRDSILYINQRDKPGLPEASTLGTGGYSMSMTMNEDGTYDGLLTYTYGTGGGEARYRAVSDASSESDGILYRNWPAPISVPDVGSGGDAFGAYRILAQSLTSEGLYDGVLLYEYPKNIKTYFESERTPFRTSASIMYDRYRKVLEVPAGAVVQGQYAVRSALNADGSYSGQLTYDAPTDGGSVAFTTSVDTLSTGFRLSYRDFPTQLAPQSSTPIAGWTYGVSQSISSDGTYSGAVDREQARRQQTQTVVRDALSSSTVQLRVVNGVAGDITSVRAAEQGEVYTREVALNRFGRFDVVTGLSTAGGPNSVYAKWKTKYGSAYSRTYVNQTIIPNPFPSSTSRRNTMSVSVNTDMTYDVTATSTPSSSGRGEEEEEEAPRPSEDWGFYYDAFSVVRVRGDDSASDFFRYLTEGFRHYVRYRMSEFSARTDSEAGWDARVSLVQGQWRSDVVIGRKVNTANQPRMLAGVGTTSGSASGGEMVFP
jgi:hypothetical protein